MSIIKRKTGSEDIVKSILEFDEVPTEGSPNLVESGAVAQAIGNLGHPLQWKGPATVAELNAGITGIQPGWTYTLTDSGTLTDGSVTVDVGDEAAWTGTAWFKVGGDTGKVAVFTFSGIEYPLIADMNAALISGKDVVLIRTLYPSRYDVFYLTYRNSGGGHVQMEFTGIEETLYCTDDTWTVKPNSVAMATSVAPSYDSTQTYPTVGTAVMYKGLRYVSNTAITTAEDWTPAHWTEKSVEDEIGNVEALLAAL